MLWFWWTTAVVVDCLLYIRSRCTAFGLEKWQLMIHGAVLEFWKISEPSQHHHTHYPTLSLKLWALRSPALASLPQFSVGSIFRNHPDQKSFCEFRKKGINCRFIHTAPHISEILVKRRRCEGCIKQTKIQILLRKGTISWDNLRETPLPDSEILHPWHCDWPKTPKTQTDTLSKSQELVSSTLDVCGWSDG